MGNKTTKERKQFVVKANDLIRKTRYDLTTQQQKIIIYCISKIKPDDEPTTEYEINIADLCEACNLDIDGGGFYYQAIKDDLRLLTHRLWVKMPNGDECTVSWIGDVTIPENSGKVKFHFHKALAPYLFELRRNYTQYRLEDILVLRGKYSIRLYELIRSYASPDLLHRVLRKEFSVSLDELRGMMDGSNYHRWADFERRVIRPAVNEINLCSDELHVEYLPYAREGRAIASVSFIITNPRAKQMLDARLTKRQRL